MRKIVLKFSRRCQEFDFRLTRMNIRTEVTSVECASVVLFIVICPKAVVPCVVVPMIVSLYQDIKGSVDNFCHFMLTNNTSNHDDDKYRHTILKSWLYYTIMILVYYSFI